MERAEAEVTVPAILYEDIPDGELFPPGSSGSVTVSTEGLTWRAARFGGHHLEPLSVPWEDIFRVKILVVIRGLSKLVELRTRYGVHWLGISIDDERAIREVIAAHVDAVEDGPTLGGM